jgi:hypothetical protein
MKMKTATIKQFDDGTFCGRIKEIQEDGTAPDIAVNFCGTESAAVGFCLDWGVNVESIEKL